MKMTNSEGRSTASVTHLWRLSAVLIMLTVLCATSCRTQQQTQDTKTLTSTRTAQAQSRTDSASHDSESIETSLTMTQVAADTAAVTVTMSQLSTMPDGSNYTAKKGRTRVTVTKSGDKITAMANTDSLQRIAEFWRRSSNLWEGCAKEALNTINERADSDTTATTIRSPTKHNGNATATILWITAITAVFIIVIAAWRIKKKITI